MEKTGDFIGTGWSFPPTFGKGGYAPRMVDGSDDIRESLRILLSTSLGERLLHPTYGCDLRRYLFESLNTALTTLIRDLVETAILYHEPRIKPEKVELEQRSEEGLLLIHVRYVIRSTNARNNFVFPFYKDEGSEVST
jgi:phage baseplate assembly protein W